MGACLGSARVSPSFTWRKRGRAEPPLRINASHLAASTTNSVRRMASTGEDEMDAAVHGVKPEAAWLSRVKEACISRDLPWGICVGLNLKARLLSYCFFVLQMGVRGGWRYMLHSLRRVHSSAWLSSGVQRNPFFCVRSILLLSNYCIPQSMGRHDSTVESVPCRRAEPSHCFMCNFIGESQTTAEQLLRGDTEKEMAADCAPCAVLHCRQASYLVKQHASSACRPPSSPAQMINLIQLCVAGAAT
ncbi:unnamed protein product [Pleuronectes platessa]|uniref:Uncharacterized protein n=1 Tax=Pleuronectes platessa TaxID=8262 RepID=A0A9N7TPZ6_PLEPL|nr:unnamed protein product [Pleuronectes platessa]